VWSSTSARALALVAGLALLGLAAGGAQAASPRVQALVVGQSGWSAGPRTVAVSSTRVNRCRVRAGLPIGVLRELRQPFRARGSCRALYVFQVRRDRERGAGGWVYKVGRRLPGRSASDPAGRLRSGQRVTWFWCRQAGNCARTLVTSARASGRRMRVTVTGYDDFGRGRRVAGATVLVRRIGSRSRRTLRTGRDGTVLVPVRRGRYRVDSRRRGLVRGFPTTARAR
jgi:hypothetical protein